MTNNEDADRAATQRLTAAASSPDPAVGLRAVRALRDLAERLEAIQVSHARDLGWTWQEIAAHLGVTRQAVHKKFRDSRGHYGRER
jgi:DNA-directed RNA polymerase specialized sigma24 family protein